MYTYIENKKFSLQIITISQLQLKKQAVTDFVTKTVVWIKKLFIKNFYMYDIDKEITRVQNIFCQSHAFYQIQK